MAFRPFLCAENAASIFCPISNVIISESRSQTLQVFSHNNCISQVTEQVRPICGHRISVEVKAAAVNARKLTSPCKKKETKRTLQAVHQLDSDDSDDIFSEPKRYSLERSEGADSKTKHRGKESMHLHLEEMFTASMILTEKVAQKPKIGNIATKEKMDATFNGDNSDGRVNATLRTVLRQDQTSPNRQSANKKGKVVPSKIDRVFAKLPMPSESPHYLARIASAPDGQGKGEAPQGRGVLGNAKSANNSQNYDAFDFVLSQDTPLTLQFPKKISKGPNVANRHGSQAVSQNVGGAISRTQDHSKNEQEALKKFFSPKKSVPSQQDHRKDGHIPKRSKIEKVVTIPREKRIDGCNYDDVFNFFANM